MLAADKISLFCPRNDLESDTILRIAEEMGIDCREVVGTWDLTMEQALAQHPTLRDLREQVVIVELSGDSERERLRQAGKIVHYIDHHDSPGAVAAVPRPSSLEQFAALTGHKLTRDQYLIAIADRDFLPGLSRVGASWAEVQELRRRERKVRGELDCYRKAEEHFQRNRRQLSELTMILAPCHFRNLMLDVAQMPRQKEYQSAAKDRRPVELPMVLAVFHDEQDRT